MQKCLIYLLYLLLPQNILLDTHTYNSSTDNLSETSIGISSILCMIFVTFSRSLRIQFCLLITNNPCIIYLMQFLETGPELVSHYNEVIAPQDVATYGGLCALATFDRAELKACTPLYSCDDFASI